MDTGQEILDYAGFIPGLGTIPDVLNATIHLARGNYEEALWSGIGAVPIVGDSVSGIRKVSKVSKVIDNGSLGSLNDALSKGKRLTKEQEKLKPLYSPRPERWVKKGGKVKVEEGNVWKYTDWEGNTVDYKNGYPDFSNYLHPRIKTVKVDTETTNERKKHFREANEKLGLGKDTDPVVKSMERSPEGYTYHHHEDGNLLLLVDKEIHRNFKHIGSVGMNNRRNK